MPRYVDAVEAETGIKELFADMPKIEFMGNVRNWREKNKQYLECLGVIRSLKTADVVEVKHGEWIKMSDADGVYWACSKCGEDIPRVSHFDPQFDLFPRLKSIEKTNFCPNCGADMRKETEDAEQTEM